MGRVVLTGIGPLTPIGIGKVRFWDAVDRGFSGIKKIERFSMPDEFYGGEINNINFKEYIDERRFRRVTELSKFTIVAMTLALNDAGVKTFESESTALVAGVTQGALNYTQQYHRTLITEGVDNVSPILFSDSVLNAHAGNGAICFGIKGAVHTLVGGATISLKALKLACRMLNSGVIESSIVVSAEELNELSSFCHSRLGMDILSEGAGAVLIENEDTMRGLSPYCVISGIASRFNPLNPKEALNTVIENSLGMAELRLKDIDFIMTDSSADKLKAQCLNNKPTGGISSFTGNAFSVTALWHIILSAMILKNVRIPESFIDNKAENHDHIRHIMVCSAEDAGAASAVILSRF